MKNLARLLLAVLATLVASAPAEATNYAVNSVARFVINVSSVAANGMPVGNDSTCDGSPANPCLTWDRGYALMPSGGTIVLNGTFASPPTYQSATATTITKSATVNALVTGGAILSGVGTTQSVQVGASGITVNFNGLIIDPSTNSGGTAARGIDLLSAASSYTFNMTDVVIRNWGSTYGIFSPSSNLKIQGAWTNVTWSGGTVNAGSYVPQLTTGSAITIAGGSCTITAQNAPNFGCQMFVGTASGASVTFTNHNTSVTANSGVAGQHYNIRLRDVVGGITGGTHVASAPANGGSSNTLTIEQSLYSINGSSITNVGVANTANSGLLCIIGEDSPANKTLAQDVVIDGCNSVGTSNAAVEGIVMGSTTRCIVRNSTLSVLATGLGAKDSTGCQFTNNTITDVTCCYLIDKGNTNSIFSGNTLRGTGAVVSGPMLYTEVNVDTGLPSTGGIYSSNVLTVAGATGQVFVDQDATSSASYSANSYNLTSGSTAVNEYKYSGINYTSCAAWKAAQEASAICNVP